MRSIMHRVLGLLAIVAVAMVAMAPLAPTADAQNYTPAEPPPGGPEVPIAETLAVIGAQQPGNGSTVTVNPDGSLTVDVADALVGIGTNVEIRACSVCVTLSSGKIPTNGILNVKTTGLGAGSHEIKVITTLPSGRKFIEVRHVTLGATAPAIAVPAPSLAFTGSSVNLPLAAGAMLVGSGGLVLLAARKREKRS